MHRIRTLSEFVLIADAQDLRPKQMRKRIARAGPGTKVVCLGHLTQIDTGRPAEGGCGLTCALHRFRGWPRRGHTMLDRGQRSPPADLASYTL